MRLAALPELVEAGVVEPRHVLARGPEAFERLVLEPLEARAADRRRRSREQLPAQRAIEPDRLEEPSAAIAGDVRDPHLRHHLEHALLERREEPALGLAGRGPVTSHLVVGGQPSDGLERETRADRVGAVTEQARDRVRVARLAGVDDE